MSARATLLAALLAATTWIAGAAPEPAAATPGARPRDGHTASAVPAELGAIAFEQKLGETIPGELELVDSEGRPVGLGELVTTRPALLVPVYYDCPMLCGLTLEGLTKALKTLSLTPGSDFDVIAFSIDPAETAEQARAARARTLARLADSGVARDRIDAGGAGWHFLVGSEAVVARLTEAIGFSFSSDEATGELAHAAGLLVLTPDGVIARVFFGVEFPPRDLRLALVEAGAGRIGNVVDQILLYCFRYDPASGRYTAAILNLVRAGGGLTLLVLLGFLFRSWRSERRLTAAENAAGAGGRLA